MSENVWPIVLKLAETWLQAKRHLAMDLAAGNGRLSIYLEQCCVSSMATGECLCVRVCVFVCAPAFFPIPSRISCPHQPHQHGRKGLGKILVRIRGRTWGSCLFVCVHLCVCAFFLKLKIGVSL